MQIVGLLLVAACTVGDGGPIDEHITPPTKCDTSYLTYENFGEPFIANWCRGCHSTGLPADMRQMAPDDVNFDTLDEIRMWSDGIVANAGGSADATTMMPPAGGPSADERALLTEWISCGAK